MLRLLDGYAGTLPVRCALRLAPLVFVRPGELIKAEWAGIDLEGAEWRYTVTKTGTPHVVPLARQAVAILREVHSLTGHGRYVFPNARYPHRERPMSHATLWSTFRALDIPRDRMTLHGFRAMARTILDEVLGFRPDFIEHQLAHAVRDPNGRAYNRTAFLPERRVMMHPRPPVRLAAQLVDLPHPLTQSPVGDRSRRRPSTAPRIEPAGGDTQHSAHQPHREARLVGSHELERRSGTEPVS